MDINLIGAINTVKLGIHYMRQSGGSIVLTNSRAGMPPYFHTDEAYGSVSGPIYAATKHGVLGMQRALKGSLAPLNIRINRYSLVHSLLIQSRPILYRHWNS